MAKRKYDYGKAYTVRFHNEDMDRVVVKVYEKFRKYYSSFSEFMAWMCFEGATNKDGQEDLNKAFNYSEIRKILKRLEDDKEKNLDDFKLLKAELMSEIKINQSLLNYIVRLLYEDKSDEFYWVNKNPDKFTSLVEEELQGLRNKVLLEVYDGK